MIKSGRDIDRFLTSFSVDQHKMNDKTDRLKALLFIIAVVVSATWPNR